MHRPPILFPFRRARYPGPRDLQAAPCALPGILCAFLLLLVLCGCASIGLTAKERAAIDSGDSAFVLMRFRCMVDNRPFEPCLCDPSLSGMRFVGFMLGSFDTFGEPRPVEVRALSEDSYAAGWTFLLLSPGYHYLYVPGLSSSAGHHRDFNQYRDDPRWQIEVPEREKWIYAGTLTLAGKRAGTLMFGDKIIEPVKDQGTPVMDDRESASRLIKRHFPDAGEVRVILMKRRHPEDPFIFRSPRPDSKKQP